MLPVLDEQTRLLIEKKERELRKTINLLKARAKVPMRRNEVAKADRPEIVKKVRVREGFVDTLLVKCFGGRGGDGKVAFARGPNLRVAPPSGGDAGKGGSVWIEADAERRSLVGIARQQRAGHGGAGGTNCKTGQDGKLCVVKVPCGTVVYRVEDIQKEEQKEDDDDEDDDMWMEEDDGDGDDGTVRLGSKRSQQRYEVVGSLDKSGDKVLVAPGGEGGRGNAAFVSSTHRSPKEATKGGTPAPVVVRLELKSLADVGLVGLPNAGKSSVLYSASSCSPKIAPYPFTTLHPSVGRILFSDHCGEFSMCDIPGLIEGAHRNVGLGHEFLRHIERTRVLAFVVDVGTPKPENDPCQAYKVLCEELNRYDPALLREKQSVVVANKMDLPHAEQGLQELRELVGSTSGAPVFPVCARRSQGFPELLLHLRELVTQRKH